ncbi:MAG: DUF4349 domain-containing protein [Phycisphaerae bacterium]
MHYMGAKDAGLAYARGPASPDAGKPAPDFDLSKGDEKAQVPTMSSVEPRKVVYTGRFNIVVGDVQASVKAARAMAEKLGGYALRVTTSAIAIRVPAEKFDTAVEELGRLGSVIDQDITAQDVTDQYTDLQIRLRNAKAAQQKLLALLEKAQGVKDTLEIEKELARLTTEIEQLEGQINKLTNQVAFATLTITFTAKPSAPAATRVRLPFRWLGDLGLERLLEF